MSHKIIKTPLPGVPACSLPGQTTSPIGNTTALSESSYSVRTPTIFDVIIDRRSTAAEKWHAAGLIKHFGHTDVLPFQIADMDFKAPPAVVKALAERAEEGVFGYERKMATLYEAIEGWYGTRHSLPIDTSHIRFSRGILNAIALTIDLVSNDGDGIIIQSPVFFEFKQAIVAANRRVVRSPLQAVNGRYAFDFAHLEQQAKDPKNKLLILCNPHNPTGRVWTREELKRVGEICRRHHVMVLSDEIHGDIVYTGHTYTPFASLSPADADNSVTCLSPAKTFNIAAVTDALVLIANGQLRERYDTLTTRFSLHKTNAFSVVAMEAAYRHGGPWLDELLTYLQGNIDFMQSFLQTEMPQVHLNSPEGTFLAWLDFRALGIEAKELELLLSRQARVALNAGYWFGRPGAGYARMTFAVPRKVLREGLERIAGVLKS